MDYRILGRTVVNVSATISSCKSRSMRVEELMPCCQERTVAVQTIKSMTRVPWDEHEQTRAPWYVTAAGAIVLMEGFIYRRAARACVAP